jgi:hypothetical protein
VLSGTTYGYDAGALIRVVLGESATRAQLAADWVMTHEMVHLALPRWEKIIIGWRKESPRMSRRSRGRRLDS